MLSYSILQIKGLIINYVEKCAKLQIERCQHSMRNSSNALAYIIPSFLLFHSITWKDVTGFILNYLNYYFFLNAYITGGKFLWMKKIDFEYLLLKWKITQCKTFLYLTFWTWTSNTALLQRRYRLEIVFWILRLMKYYILKVLSIIWSFYVNCVTRIFSFIIHRPSIQIEKVVKWYCKNWYSNL